jgi:hypothetical protein
MLNARARTHTHGERKRERTSKLYWSLDAAAIALSRFFLPTKHHGHTVSELISILISFFSVLFPTDWDMIPLYLQGFWNITVESDSNPVKYNSFSFSHKITQDTQRVLPESYQMNNIALSVYVLLNWHSWIKIMPGVLFNALAFYLTHPNFNQLRLVNRSCPSSWSKGHFLAVLYVCPYVNY